MDAEGLRALFEPVGPVSVKRMFGGHGVYADGLCFAIESDGEVYLKADAEAEKVYAKAGSTQFEYVMRGKPMKMAYSRLVSDAYDDFDELKRWSALAIGAARRAAAAKSKPALKRGANERKFRPAPAAATQEPSTKG
jgi:DNA transformation protein